MAVLFMSCVVLVWALCIGAAVWAVRTRHARKVWRTMHRDTSQTAIVLELEERVLELEAMEAPTVRL